jgi:hemolysin activation/secretion protein
LALSSNYSTYFQTVAGRHVSYEYSGHSRNTIVELSRMVHRGGQSKTTLGAAATVSSSKNYIDDVELEIQRRRLGGWEAFLDHRHYVGALTLDGGLRYHRGTWAFNTLRTPEEEVGEGTSRPSILSFSLRGNYPFQLGGQNFRYSGQWRQQRATNRLVSRDRFTIGGRYSVRGYDGDTTLSADNGYSVRNELGWNVAGSGQELYAAFDIGRVWGPLDEYLLGRTLSGGALGLRGGFKELRYDAFMSKPLSRPDGFPGNGLVTGFSLGYSF